ncbi:MAG: hypothetical protein QF886_26565, partial [Planctomycetota bacterium]|nr:hypothetical protein [Planctomycetota bacterium]
MLRQKYLSAGRFMKELGIDFLFAHYPDTGNENYQNRCSKCENRFGPDRAKADANVTNIIFKALSETPPKARLIACPHPYTPSNLRYPELEEFLKDYSSRIPSEVYLTIREARREFVDKWNRATANRPVFVYYENRRVVELKDGRHSGVYKPIFETNARYLKTFLHPGTDSIIMCPWRDKPIDIMALQEYAWNANAPGASDAFGRPPVVYEKDSQIPPVMVTQVYQKIARQIFGEETGKAFAPLCGIQIFPLWIFQPELIVKHVAHERDDFSKAHPFKGDLIARVKEQADRTRRAVEIVDEIVDGNLPFRSDHAKKVFAHYYKLIHLIHRSAPCRLTYLEAKASM